MSRIPSLVPQVAATRPNVTHLNYCSCCHHLGLFAPTPTHLRLLTRLLEGPLLLCPTVLWLSSHKSQSSPGPAAPLLSALCPPPHLSLGPSLACLATGHFAPTEALPGPVLPGSGLQRSAGEGNIASLALASVWDQLRV